MMMGKIADEPTSSLAYVYMSKTGIGSAYYMDNHIIRGHQSFSGELGLIPYQNQTINKVIASQPSLDELEKLYTYILTTIAVTIDPEKIIISGKNLNHLSIENKMKDYLSLRYSIDFKISLFPLEDALNGLAYLAVLKLFDIYTDYKRG